MPLLSLLLPEQVRHAIKNSSARQNLNRKVPEVIHSVLSGSSWSLEALLDEFPIFALHLDARKVLQALLGLEHLDCGCAGHAASLSNLLVLLHVHFNKVHLQ